ncbi:MAG TPA: outer membrane protein transport protein [Minicystis sp.]|nr:outer membrane protein transport protein [Minicystis sp.]
MLAGAVFAAAAAVCFAPDAGAAGLYFADRGVRPAGRGGAFIAGADDLGAIAYNPAGLYDAGSAFLFDASWLHFTSEYTRQAILRQVDPNTGRTVATFEKTFPTVDGASPVLPIPTVAYSFQPHKQWVVAIGAWAPYAAITSYPDQLNGKPSPQRYSLQSLEGSALAFVGVAAAFAPNREWRIGVGVGALVGTFDSTVAFSGCIPERFFCAPEDPDWDVAGKLSVGPIVAPSGELGAIWIPSPKWRLGASVQLPVYVRAGGTIETRLPSTPVFERAKQVGDDVSVAFDLPWNVRVGVENRLVDDLRVEVGFGFERWSMHDAITVTPNHLALEDVAGLPKDYFVPTIKIPRDFQDSVSVRAGGEYSFKLLGYQWEGRGGVSFETSAVPNQYLSVLTIDSNKVTASLGLGLHVNKWRFDAVYGHVFAFDQTVDPRQAKIAQIVPVSANPPKTPDNVNGGQYSARADVVGVGLNYQFDVAPAEFSPEEEKKPAAAPAKPPAEKPASKPEGET